MHDYPQFSFLISIALGMIYPVSASHGHHLGKKYSPIVGIVLNRVAKGFSVMPDGSQISSVMLTSQLGAGH